MKTLLFGAGASIEFFNPALSTVYLTNQIKSLCRWKKAIDRFNNIANKNGYSTILEQNVIDTLNAIEKNCPNYNFEQIIEILDKIASYCFDSIQDNILFNSVIKTFCEIDLLQQGNTKFNAGWKYIPFLSRTIIAESIIELQEEHKNTEYDTYIQLQEKFIDSFAGNDKISIISFNYDDLLINSAKNLGLETGFDNALFDATKLHDAQRALSFPHGHIRFFFDDKGNVSCLSDAKTANDKRWNNLCSMSMGATTPITSGGTFAHSDSFAYNFNTFITTGKTKDDSFNRMPYSFYYQKMAHDILESEQIVIIGYSFGDAHINRLLSVLPDNCKITNIDIKSNGLPRCTDFTKGYIDFLLSHNSM